ncbi:valine--tRNA ligase [Caldinitratiruptor microaerophilus]|uniref:Valine--tRNA ligase n=1 Tax=Caldinitratiruptor microaerophilus TaxID=671077 RepID=A0AA35G6L5_9FIRM|nr:valine--tRNA ligase [Caldinitratiruptor microaerophilus]BDG61516.1 valine--tRNA ligase [Caldinitratiruptor microaerophilus]
MSDPREAGAELPSRYSPAEVEAETYRFWLDGDYFRAPIVEGRDPFSIAIPPPNVTGALHMGHALDNTLQDILIRWHRMRGDPTLWLPGTDHAGLATQIKVEEVLRKEEGLTRHDLGRERFVERVWEWKRKYGDTIIRQLQRLGASCDWSRERFTMDEGCSRAVRAFFVQLYKKGLIYRGQRMINWCPQDGTALSDIEVEHEETEGRLWYFRYPLEDGSGFISVATTRPETMLGDTAVAVHPDDERYRHLVGKKVRHPATGRLIPIVADEYVDPAFGTGAVKITPFHDPNDLEVAQRHGLEAIQVIGWKGEITEAGGRYAGMDRYECRRQIVADMEAAGFLEKVETHVHALGRCQRCDTVVEPLVSTQWFVKMKPLAEPAIQAVKDGRVRILPERFEGVYLHWLENIKDWCISRQIYWGHRIPVWTCKRCGAEICEMEDPTVCPQCGSTELEQDPDCLDTWFSSALWPFSTLGWPDPTEDYRYFYPTTVNVTGYDILFFWVARMIFSALELTGEVPFRTVVLHGLVRDSQGRKMSKSLGNGIDPLEVIDRYGADALRFMLATGNSPGNDLRFYWERVEAARNFANKLWNASRFALMNLRDFDPAGVPDYPAALTAHGRAEDRWIVTRLQEVAGAVQGNLERFELGLAATALYDFIWDEFCDWYIEMVKPRLYGKDEEQGEAAAESRQIAQYTLWYVLDGILHLLHPFMPYITEAIWQKLVRPGGLSATVLVAAGPGADPAAVAADLARPERHAAWAAARAKGAPPALVVDPWPVPVDALRFPDDARTVGLWMEVIRAVRALRADAGVPAGRRADVVLVASTPELQAALEGARRHLVALAHAAGVTVLPAGSPPPEQAVAAVVSGAEVYVPLKGVVDVEKEIGRLAREREEVARELERSRTKLANPDFVSRAAPQAVEKERQKEADLSQRLSALDSRLALLERVR